jgi:phosphate starvation-inducible PhoH-like protein
MSKRPSLRLVESNTEYFDNNGQKPRTKVRKASKPEMESPRKTETATGERYIKNIQPRSPNQAKLIEAIKNSSLIMALGPAGTGKTYIAVRMAIEALQSGRVKRIILSRPAVEAGERLGFLPGDPQEKIAPYMRPLYDVLYATVGVQKMNAMLFDRTIEIAPIGFMRGRNLIDCAVILDEAQNATKGQLKMVITRLGLGSFMVITGDPDQSDLDEGDSGLACIAENIKGRSTDASVMYLDGEDIVRHPVIKELLPYLMTA